nr:unnamed protein product [Leishmania braziliensis]
MLVRSPWWRAPQRARHTWMVLMTDECATMAPLDIAAFVQRTFDDGCWAPAKGSAVPAAGMTTSGAQSAAVAPVSYWPVSSSPLAASGPPPLPIAGAPAARAHAWAAVARLLCESGDWVRAAAVVDGLPLPEQQAARHKAVRDEWPLPLPVRESWRLAATARAAAAAPLPAPGAECPAGALQSVALPSREPLASCRTTELVRVAYGLSRPRAADAAVAASAGASAGPLRGPRSEQQAIVAELCRRGAVLEAVQCVANWQRRHLALAEAEEATPAAATDTRAGAFDGVKAVTAALFPFAPTRGAGDGARARSGAPAGADWAFGPHSAPRSGRPPLYSLAHLQVIRQVAASHPVMLAQCLRGRGVVDRLLCHAGEAVAAEVALLLLGHIAGLGGGVAERGLAAPKGVASAETCWRALAALLFPLHPCIHAQPKTGKEKLLSALLAALDATAHMGAADRVHTGRTSSAAGGGGTVSLPVQGDAGVRRGGRTPVVLSDRARSAIKAAVESVCSPLLSHAAQVRFIRLPTFGQLARALGDLGVAVPNALAQCLFLCMADAAVPPPASGASSDTVAQYLSCDPPGRWLHALAMLDAAHRESAYRVSAAHERALLSGLQSISITRTWTAALRTVAALEGTHQVLPDERTLPTLLLNLKQQSWQNAFHVLRYVPGGEADRASPSVLRDLQLVALKHASWVVPLRLMAHLQRRQADGFMSYLYCLCAAARGGNAELAFEHFQSLRRGRGRHSALLLLSPYNELTVGVAAVAMLDGGHEEALVSFSTRVVAMRAAGDTAAPAAEAAAASGRPLLTAGGREMAQAAHVCALLALHRHSALASFLAGCAAASLPAVLRRVVVLQCLLGLDHLRAPVRLVFDVVGYRGGTLQGDEVRDLPDAGQSPLRGFLVAVAADQQGGGTFETRQRGAAERRQHLYISVAHQRRQKKALAAAWGLFMREQEAVLPPHVARLVAESMVEEGVGAEYLTAALL